MLSLEQIRTVIRPLCADDHVCAMLMQTSLDEYRAIERAATAAAFERAEQMCREREAIERAKADNAKCFGNGIRSVPRSISDVMRDVYLQNAEQNRIMADEIRAEAAKEAK